MIDAVAILPAPEASSRRHIWNVIPAQRVLACDVPEGDGNDRTLRVCNLCSMIKVTVHAPNGHAWREWRTSNGKIWVGDATPPCLEISEGA